MIRHGLVVLSVIGVFSFPWMYTAAVIFLAALYMPYLALAFGVLYDALYYIPGAGWPLATITGGVGSLIAVLANRFLRSRVTDFPL